MAANQDDVNEQQKKKKQNKPEIEVKSKRKRFDDDEPLLRTDHDLQCILAKQLSDYLDSAIEEVVITKESEEYDSTQDVKKQSDDFQLFSTSCGYESNKTKPTFKIDDSSQTQNTCDSSDDEHEDYARFQAAAVSAEDVFSSNF